MSHQPRSFQEAAALLADKKYTLPVLKAGGIDLMDHLKEGLTEPDLVVNVRTLKSDSATVEGCAVAPDASFLVSTGSKAAAGEERRSFEGHARLIRSCAISPDGSLIVSAGDDGMFKLWETRDGRALATLPILGGGLSVAFHPWLPLAVCGDESGNVHQIDLVGIGYAAPIIVTAVNRGALTNLRCPACWLEHRLDESPPAADFSFA